MRPHFSLGSSGAITFSESKVSASDFPKVRLHFSKVRYRGLTFSESKVVELSLNRSKGARGPNEWLPPSGQCGYVARFARVVKQYELKPRPIEAKRLYHAAWGSTSRATCSALLI
jgi:hypothetical protein